MRNLWSVEFNRRDGEGWKLSAVFPKLREAKASEYFLRKYHCAGCVTRIRKWWRK